ncbi:MAG TPA: nickel pincer cofactor biosynthesis protein LarC [Gemmataceae bacterium]|nr:nickel pincer cofactor biosynthesis protein LarC [Gemmataceae bacterium]
MRVLHFDCFSGISGDMTVAALIDAGVDPDAVRAALDSFGLPITLEIERVKRNGIAATYVNVIAPDQEEYRFLPDVEAILAKGKLTPRQRDRALAIFRKLASAEAAVHGMPVERVHFHEVGALDSIADIAGAAVAIDLLGVDRITCRSVPPGRGSVKCAHGLMPVPAPATAHLLQGMPLAQAPVTGELVTPTGAAILATVVNEFTDQPAMTVERIGCGAGKKDFWEQPNVLRVFVGAAADERSEDESDTVTVLETNLDDVAPEVIGYTFDRLFAAGALDVFAVPVHMKKNRPGTLLTVIAPAAAAPALEAILFRETGTFGVRRHTATRTKLRREPVTVSTPWGPVQAKKGWRDGVELIAPEYEDCARIARAHDIPLRAVYEAVRAAFSPSPESGRP